MAEQTNSRLDFINKVQRCSASATKYHQAQAFRASEHTRRFARAGEI